MRKSLALALILLLAVVPLWAQSACDMSNACPAAGGISLVNSTAQGLGVAGGTTPTAVDMTGANLCVGATSNLLMGAATLTSSPANTWTALPTYGSSIMNDNITIFYVYNPTVSSSMTFTSTGSFESIAMYCFKGATGAAADQQNGSGAPGDVTSIQPGSITPSANKEVVLSFRSVQSAITANAIDSGFVTPLLLQTTGGQFIGITSSYLIQPTAGAVNPTWSWVTGDQPGVAIATFK